MNTFWPQLLLLILSALGYFTYKHPTEARKVNTIIASVLMAISIAVNCYITGRIKGYNKSLITISNIDVRQDKIYESVIQLRQSDEIFHSQLTFFAAGIVIYFFVFLYLSWLFEDIHKKMIKENDESTPDNAS